MQLSLKQKSCHFRIYAIFIPTCIKFSGKSALATPMLIRLLQLHLGSAIRVLIPLILTLALILPFVPQSNKDTLLGIYIDKKLSWKMTSSMFVTKFRVQLVYEIVFVVFYLEILSPQFVMYQFFHI